MQIHRASYTFWCLSLCVASAIACESESCPQQEDASSSLADQDEDLFSLLQANNARLGVAAGSAAVSSPKLAAKKAVGEHARLGAGDDAAVAPPKASAGKASDDVFRNLHQLEKETVLAAAAIERGAIERAELQSGANVTNRRLGAAVLQSLSQKMKLAQRTDRVLHSLSGIQASSLAVATIVIIAAVVIVFAACLACYLANYAQTQKSSDFSSPDPPRQAGAGLLTGATSAAARASPGVPTQTRAHAGLQPHQRSSPQPPTTSPFGSSREVASVPPTSREIGSYSPVLCPSLSLPACESRFAVKAQELANLGPTSTMNIVTLTGLPLLSMRITDGNKLDIGQAAAPSQPRCSVTAPADHNGAFIIRDPNNQPYGKFETRMISPSPSHPNGTSAADVYVAGKVVMQVEFWTRDLQFSVVSPTSTPMAIAGVNSKDYRGDHLEIRSLPGADAVLVLAVILALTVFTSSEPGSPEPVSRMSSIG